MGIKQSLRKFLHEAGKATYASGNDAKKELDGSRSFYYESGDWKYYDNYFGGEPFGGREVVFYQNKPLYMMIYYGRVNDDISDFKDIYGFLQKALRMSGEDQPARGPELFAEDDFEYHNSFIGEVDNFFGEEAIYQSGKKIYQARYAGGLVDQK